MVEVPEGNVVIYCPGEPQYYRYKYQDSAEVYFIHFTGNEVHSLLCRMNLINHNIHFTGCGKEYIILFNEIMHELQFKYSRFEEFSSSLLLLLLNRIARAVDLLKTKGTDKTFEKVLKLIHTNYNNNYSIQHYAKQCNLSIYWFTHKFKKFTGLPPTAYIKQLKINEAKDLLSNFSLNIYEIAYAIGYENALYFSKVFRQETGFTPTEYRKKFFSSPPNSY